MNQHTGTARLGRKNGAGPLSDLFSAHPSPWQQVATGSPGINCDIRWETGAGGGGRQPGKASVFHTVLEKSPNYLLKLPWWFAWYTRSVGLVKGHGLGLDPGLSTGAVTLSRLLSHSFLSLLTWEVGRQRTMASGGCWEDEMRQNVQRALLVTNAP